MSRRIGSAREQQWAREQQKPGLESVKESSSEKNSTKEVELEGEELRKENCEAKSHVPDCRQIYGCLLGQLDQGRQHHGEDACEEAPRIQEELFCG